MNTPGNFEYLVQVVQDLSLARSLDAITAIVRTAARKLAGADGATFVLLDNDHCYYADEDAISPLWKGGRFPVESCISGWAMINRQQVTIEDIYRDNRIPHDLYKPTFVRSLSMIPIRRANPLGAIGVYWARPHVPESRELALLQSLADMTTVAIENVNVYLELENRVARRTAELEAARKSIEAYSHSISHDLKAPLRSIKLLSDMLLERSAELGLQDAELNRITNRILNRVEHMDALIAGLLDFAQLGKHELSWTQVPMRELAEEVGRELLEHHPERTIHFSVGKHVPDAWGDALLIRQALQNLIGNAIKYTGKKDPARIEVGFDTIDNYNRYSVTDNGAGFNPTDADGLFEVFHRLHSEKEFDGIGIGLSLTKRIINRHSGEIDASAKVNEGATFRFTLPKSPSVLTT